MAETVAMEGHWKERRDGDALDPEMEKYDENRHLHIDVA